LRDPRADELPVLRLLAEQIAVPLDQLARLLDCGLDFANDVAWHLWRAGLVEIARPLPGEQAWVWLARRKCLASLGLFGTSPRPGRFQHYRAVTDVRLHFGAELPRGHWFSGRSLRHGRQRAGTFPDAVVEEDGRCHAVEVRLTSGPKQSIKSRIDVFSETYDAVTVYCGSEASLTRNYLRRECDWPNVQIQSLPVQSVSYSKTDIRSYKVASWATILDRLCDALSNEAITACRARNVAGYLLLGPTGIDQPKAAVSYELRRECRKLGLLSKPSSRYVEVERPPLDVMGAYALIGCLYTAVERGEIQPHRARVLAGYRLLAAAGWHGLPDTDRRLERLCVKLGVPSVSEGGP